MAPTVLVHGSGAIGSIYVYLLIKAGFSVTAVCRSNHDAAKANGFLIDSEKYGNNLRAHPKIVRTPAEAAEQGGVFDYIIVTSKAIPEDKTSELIAPAVTEGKTCIALFQNGVGIEEEFADRFPQNPLLSVVVYLPSTQIEPAHMRMGNFEMLQIGSFPASAYKEKAGVKQAADTFVGMLQKAGSNAKWYDDVQEMRWRKLMLNASWNPVCALSLSRDVAFLASAPDADREVGALMMEVVHIAQALGYSSVNEETQVEQLKRAKDRVGGEGIEPSMLVDALNGRRMEVETILGNAVRTGRKAGVAVPKLELLYALAKALDESMLHRQPGQSLKGTETRAERGKTNAS